MKKIAKFIRELDDFNGIAKMYKVSPPLKGSEYVAVSAAYVSYSGDETYIFPCDENGHVTNWSELDGSFRGELDHARALANAGYTIE